MISINFGWSYLSGFIFMFSAVMLAGFCFILNVVSSVFGKGRSVLFGALSLYLNLMSTLAFNAPDFFSGLGLQKWFSMSMIFFIFTTGSGVALVSFERFSKIVSLLIIVLNISVIIPNNSLVRGMVGVINGIGNLFSRKINDLDQNLTPTPELIRQRYVNDYNKKKHELIDKSEKGLITAEEYEQQLIVLDNKYKLLIQPKEEEKHVVQKIDMPMPSPPPSSITIPSVSVPSEDYVNHYISCLNSGQISQILPLYADQVDYYEKGIVDRSFIKLDKIAYYKRWPEVFYSLKGSVFVNKISNDGVYEVVFDINFILVILAEIKRCKELLQLY